MKKPVLAILTLMSAAPAFAQTRQPAEPSAPGAVPSILSCAAFPKDADHAFIVKSFGAANVKFTKVPGPEGSELAATVVFGKDAGRRLEISWMNEKARKIPNVMVRGAGSAWKTADGIAVGTTLAEIERLNGKPFKLSGFEWDMGGYVTGFNGGALSKRDGGCHFGLRFEPGANAPAAAAAKTAGDREFSSTDANMRAMGPVVSEINIGWRR